VGDELGVGDVEYLEPPDDGAVGLAFSTKPSPEFPVRHVTLTHAKPTLLTPMPTPMIIGPCGTCSLGLLP
jgi:hypothetical protein